MLFVRIEYVNEIDMMMVHRNMESLEEYSVGKVLIHTKDYYNHNVRKQLKKYFVIFTCRFKMTYLYRYKECNN